MWFNENCMLTIPCYLAAITASAVLRTTARSISRKLLQAANAVVAYIPMVYTRPVTRSTVFKTNQTQAVRIPKALAFPDHVKAVTIKPVGNGLLISPVENSWEEFMKGPRLDDDFERPPQPEPQKREDW
jgi:antitoxin VapB